MNASLEDRLLGLELQEKEFLHLLASLIIPGTEFTAFQLHAYLFVFGIGKRTVAQSVGFRSMIGARNFICGAGLLRMQIDSAMRLNAVNLVQDVASFLDQWIAGKKISMLKSDTGQKLTDFYLVERLGEIYPWVPDVYSQTSSFIHFSSRHAWATVTRVDEEEREFHFQIGPHEDNHPDEAFLEIVDAFAAANQMIGDLTKGAFVHHRK